MPAVCDPSEANAKVRSVSPQRTLGFDEAQTITAEARWVRIVDCHARRPSRDAGVFVDHDELQAAIRDSEFERNSRSFLESRIKSLVELRTAHTNEENRALRSLMEAMQLQKQMYEKDKFQSERMRSMEARIISMQAVHSKDISAMKEVHNERIQLMETRIISMQAVHSKEISAMKEVHNERIQLMETRITSLEAVYTQHRKVVMAEHETHHLRLEDLQMRANDTEERLAASERMLQCIGCWKKNREVAFFPCRHLVYCGGCYKSAVRVASDNFQALQVRDPDPLRVPTMPVCPYCKGVALSVVTSILLP
jgi:hypothetical protein